MTTKFLAKNENDVSLFHKMLHDDDFHRISNCFWYETWENADGDKVEIERDFQNKGDKNPHFYFKNFYTQTFYMLITKPEPEYKNFEFRLSDLYSDSNNGLLIS